MRLNDIISAEEISEGRLVWRKMGNKVKRGIRCTSGFRKGRVVAKAAQCSAPRDMKKRLTLKKTKARMGKRMAFRARRTKRMNPLSRRVRALNRPSYGGRRR